MNKTKVRLELQLDNMEKLIRIIDQEGFISFALKPSFLTHLKNSSFDKKSKILKISGRNMNDVKNSDRNLNQLV
jgi:hypothetical protein